MLNFKIINQKKGAGYNKYLKTTLEEEVRRHEKEECVCSQTIKNFLMSQGFCTEFDTVTTSDLKKLIGML